MRQSNGKKNFLLIEITNRVTLNIRNNLNERRTDTPKDSSGLKCVQITSKIEPKITFKRKIIH